MAAVPDCSEEAEVFNLRVNRSLLEPNFDRYILRNEKMHTSKTQLDKSVNYKLPGIRQWGYEQIKAHTLTERLVLDQFRTDPSSAAFYVVLEDNTFVSVFFNELSRQWTHSVEHFQIPKTSLGEDAFPASFYFLDANFAVLSNGEGGFSICKTGNRNDSQKLSKWQEVFSYSLSELHPVPDSTPDTSAIPPFPVLILDVRKSMDGDDGKANYEILLFTVTQKSREIGQIGEKETQHTAIKQRPKGCFRSHLIWTTLTANDLKSGDPKFAVMRVREAVSDGRVEYGCLDADSRRLVVFGDIQPRFVWDSQSPPIVFKQEVEIAPEAMEEEETVGGGNEAAEKFAAQEEGEAPQKMDLSAQDTSPGFNAEQLEECDTQDVSDDVLAFWLDGESHQLHKMTSLNQLLFTSRFAPNEAPHFVTRSDVDAVVWKHSPGGQGDGLASHHLTLNAFAFIQAGHQDKRFCGCAPSGDYAVLINKSKHAFLYLQNASISNDCELKNRKTGKQANTIAKQLVLNVNAEEGEAAVSEFVGFHAGEQTLFLATQNGTIYASEIPK